MTKRILITGASGFLGYNLCNDLGENHEIYATTHSLPVAADVKGIVNLDLTGSLKEIENFIQMNNINVIIHCAAMSNVGPCARDPRLAKLINVKGSSALASIAARNRIRFIFISTDLVYNSGPGPHPEDDADPQLIYSQTKFDAEMELFIACPSSIVLRSALIFGVDDGEHGSFVRDNERDLNAGKTLTLFTDQFRTPVWSRDISRAIELILASNVRSEIYNIGGDTRINRYDLGLILSEMFDWNLDQIIPVSMESITKNAPYLKDCSLDSTRLMVHFDWKPTPLRDALQELAKTWKPAT